MPLPICVYCRFWEPIFIGDDFDPDEPGSCTGQIGKWAMLNGMWMKAADNCEQWQLSPLRANKLYDWIPADAANQSTEGSK